MSRFAPLRAAFIVSFAIACSASGGDAGDETSGGAGGAGAQGGNGGGAGNTQRPDPGAPPSGAVGVVQISSTADEGAKTTLNVGATFTNPATNLGTTAIQAFLRRYAGIPIDTCVDLARGLTTSSSDQPNLSDAGRLTVKPPGAGASVVQKTTFASFVFYNQDLPAAAFVPNGEYRLAGGGGAVQNFEGSFWAPSDLSLTAPSLGAGAVSVPRSAPLRLAWHGTPDGFPVVVYLVQDRRTFTCRVADDGAFEVPVATLTQLDPSGGAGDPNDQPDRVEVLRYTWYAVGQAAPNVASAIVNFEVGARFEASFD